MKNSRTYYHLLLDRSGSMNSCLEQTIDGVNQQIRRIKDVGARFPEQKLITSLMLFNNHLTPVWNMLPPQELREISFSDYKPDGSTALLDAIGYSVNEIKNFSGAELDADEASCIIVIITDGYENSSVNFSSGQISSLIKELEQTGRWTFSYIGATLDSVEIAEKLSIKSSNAMRFDLNESFYMYNKLDNSIDSYISNKQSGKIDPDFLDDGTK